MIRSDQDDLKGRSYSRIGVSDGGGVHQSVTNTVPERISIRPEDDGFLVVPKLTIESSSKSSSLKRKKNDEVGSCTNDPSSSVVKRQQVPRRNSFVEHRHNLIEAYEHMKYHSYDKDANRTITCRNQLQPQNRFMKGCEILRNADIEKVKGELMVKQLSS